MFRLCHAAIFLITFNIASVFSFSPDTSSFDNYGLKVAANELLLVEALQSQSSFLLRLSPFNYSLICTVSYDDPNHYIYAVAVAQQATVNSTIQFVFIGINIQTDIPFIGSLSYTGISAADYINKTKGMPKTVFPCDGWNMTNYRIHSFQQFMQNNSDLNNNMDFFVTAVEPMNQLAYAFAENFLLVYNLATDTVFTQLGSLTWPDSSFLPRATDISASRFIVVVGYVGSSNTNYTPCAYLLDRSNATLKVLDAWFYSAPTNKSWQATLTNWDADSYAVKYDMSVSINNVKSQALLGIQIVNTIVILDINQTTNKFDPTPQIFSNGKGIGMGKAVNWLGSNLAIVLVNTYSLSYIWSSSQIYIYNTTTKNAINATSIIPNVQQTLAPTFGPIILSFAVTQRGTVAVLDSQSNVYILLPSTLGFFSDSSSRSYSSSTPCIGGTFSSTVNILPCSLCPSGTTTNGLVGQFACVACASDAFCPLGAAFGNISGSNSLLLNKNQARAYPISPQSVRYDNILMQNMFVIQASVSQHCLLVSPLFWALITMAVCTMIAILMLILKLGVFYPQSKKISQLIKCFFRQADLVGEGELWMGGMASFAIIILVVSAYIFSSAYFPRYPLENLHGDASFACDPTLSNAQFSSGLMALTVPPNDDEIPLFDLLNAQPFTLTIDFVNTLFQCTDLTLVQIKDTILPLTISTCTATNGSVSLSALLPSHGINVQLQMTGTNTIGAVRLGLTGYGSLEKSESSESNYYLLDLDFAQVFSVPNRVLTQQPSFTIQLTKVINRTYPLEEDGPTDFSGLWLPYVSVDVNQIFVDENEYRYSTSSSTIVSIVVSETSFYVLNTQKPITDEAELIFTNLLFTIVCIEIFGLIFLIFKLIVVPLIDRIRNGCRRQGIKKDYPREEFDLPHNALVRF